ncbi:MAG: hypothetical protein JW959_12255 [Pirellulales bacterium]|nr:hypothetical protein [Pirellulales bacterium]
MSLIARFRLLYSCYFSKPSADRPIYRAVHRLRARKIVELGIGDGSRALRMIAVARLVSPGRIVNYIGLDRFEDRPGTAERGLTLKEAHRLLGPSGGLVRLVPGEPAESLARTANSLGKVDLLVLPGEMESPTVARAWFFVPRMLHRQSVVFIERVGLDGRRKWDIVPRERIDALAASGAVRRAA